MLVLDGNVIVFLFAVIGTGAIGRSDTVTVKVHFDTGGKCLTKVLYITLNS